MCPKCPGRVTVCWLADQRNDFCIDVFFFHALEMRLTVLRCISKLFFLFLFFFFRLFVVVYSSKSDILGRERCRHTHLQLADDGASDVPTGARLVQVRGCPKPKACARDALVQVLGMGLITCTGSLTCEKMLRCPQIVLCENIKRRNYSMDADLYRVFKRL